MLSTAITMAVKTMAELAGPCRFGMSAASHSDHGMRLSAHIHHSSGRCWRIPARKNAPSMARICPGPHGQPPHQAAGTSGTSSSASQPIRQASIGCLAASGSGATTGMASSSCPGRAKAPPRLATQRTAVATTSAACAAWRSCAERHRHTGGGSGPASTWISPCHARFTAVCAVPREPLAARGMPGIRVTTQG